MSHVVHYDPSKVQISVDGRPIDGIAEPLELLNDLHPFAWQPSTFRIEVVATGSQGSLHDFVLRMIGPRVDRRVRRKRLAKKIRARGGMRRCDGIVQRYYRAWPEMQRWLP